MYLLADSFDLIFYLLSKREDPDGSFLFAVSACLNNAGLG